jgi:hypothetical protein
VLTDATADIDGLSICDWRHAAERLPSVSYQNLTVVIEPPHTKQMLSAYLSKRKNITRYVAWAHEVIERHVKPGQLGLVVVKQELIEPLAVIPETPKQLSTKGLTPDEEIEATFTWKHKGRKLATTYWGGNAIGNNAWQYADVVIQLSEYLLPKRASIANGNGLWDLKSIEGSLARMKDLRSPDPIVGPLWEGHTLRWITHLALRGKARQYDGNGVCGVQRLVLAVDQDRIMANFSRLFPGAPPPRIEKSNSKQRKSKSTHSERLLQTLSEHAQRAKLGDKLTTKVVSEKLGLPWRSVANHFGDRLGVKQGWEALGWLYHSRPGRGGSWFEFVGTKPSPSPNHHKLGTLLAKALQGEGKGSEGGPKGG